MRPLGNEPSDAELSSDSVGRTAPITTQPLASARPPVQGGGMRVIERDDTVNLADGHRRHAFAEQGFVTLPLLDAADVERLRSLHRRSHPEPGRGFDTDFAYMAPDHKRRLATGIAEVVGPKLRHVLSPFRLFNATFVVKWPGADSTVPLHQDWAYVDESMASSATVWIPLQDTSRARGNGPIAFVPGSHRVAAPWRGANSIPWYDVYQDQLRDHLRPVDVPAGHAAVFDGRVLHGSTDNDDDRPRLAVAAMVAPADAPLRYYHLTDGVWEVYEVDEDFFCRHAPVDLRSSAPADAELVASVPYEPQDAPLEELADHCGIVLDRRPPAGSGSSRLAGVALGTSEPSPGTGRLAGALHSGLRRRRQGPIVPTKATRALAAATDLASRLPDLDEVEEPLEYRSTTQGGSWRALRLEAGRPGAPGRLRAQIDAVVGTRDVWLVEVAGGTELKPGRAGANHLAMVVLPLCGPRLEGTLQLQVDGEVRAIAPGAPAAFDPTYRHTVRNIGADTVRLLCVAVDWPADGDRAVRFLTWMARQVHRRDRPVLPCDR